MKLTDVILRGTCTSGGTLTLNATRAILGKLYAVQWIDGTFADGVDAVLSVQKTDSAVAQTLLTLTDADDDAWYFPRVGTCDTAGAASLYAAGGEPVEDKMVVNGTLRLAITSGGNAKEGGAIVYIEV